jgi:(p)ppGpp synthase/HD superfamily hydrolase
MHRWQTAGIWRIKWDLEDLAFRNVHRKNDRLLKILPPPTPKRKEVEEIIGQLKSVMEQLR